MDILLFAVMSIVLVYVGIKNFKLIKRYKQNKEYISIYQSVLNNEENSYNLVKNFIENEKTQEFKNKGKIIKLYSELCNDIDSFGTIDDIDLNSIFCKKGQVDKEMTNLNVDSFVFIALAIAKAFEKKKEDVIVKIIDKLKGVEGLKTHLEYNTIISFANSLLSIEDKGIPMMRSLLEGTYTDYVYEKNMIGLFKRIASTTLAYNNLDFEEYFKQDLYNFAQSLIGEKLLQSLGMYETYKNIEDKVDVVNPQIIEKNIEETKKDYNPDDEE